MSWLWKSRFVLFGWKLWIFHFYHFLLLSLYISAQIFAPHRVINLYSRSGRLGRWAMAKLNINESQFLSPHTNPQERFHRLCNYFQHWGSLSLEQLIRAFNYLFIFFVNELSLRDSGNGAFVLKEYVNWVYVVMIG